MGSTRKPTTSFSVVVLTNTSTTLINGVEKVLEKLGYTPSVIRVEVRGSKHIDRYGRLLVAKKKECIPNGSLSQGRGTKVPRMVRAHTASDQKCLQVLGVTIATAGKQYADKMG